MKLATVALGLLAPACAWAQVNKVTPAARMPPTHHLDRGFNESQTRLYWQEVSAATRAQKRSEGEALKAASPERVARAERVAALLNEGKCKDAAMYALDQGDNEMAAKVANVCRKSAAR
jgi:hypothetical protein